jgi:hypothetical protein
MDATKQQKLENYIRFLLDLRYAYSTVIRMASQRLDVKPNEAKTALNKVINLL